jgi:hopanoid biosynthesis associated protein HpnK
MEPCSLIVHGDDFGLSEGLNKGIVQAHRQGILTSTSLVASGVAFEHAVELAQTTPSLDIGVHLTLSDERPVLPPASVPTLLGSRERMHRDAATFTRRYLLGRISLDEVARELDAQIAKVRSQGLNVTHLDGHQHLHMLPGIRPVVGELARKHGIPAIRYPFETPRAYMLRQPAAAGRLAQLLALDTFCTLANVTDAKRTDHFVGFFFGGRLDKGNLLEVLSRLPRSGTCELMCHPGLADPGSGYGHWSYLWEEELAALTDGEVREFLRSRGIGLISYADLGRVGADRASSAGHARHPAGSGSPVQPRRGS